MKKWQECYDNKATLPIFDMQTQEAGKFNLGWTPGTLVINNKTGKYTTIEGAYPTSQFETAIESVLK
jgi:protein-disulfide isomerase